MELPARSHLKKRLVNQGLEEVSEQILLMRTYNQVRTKVPDALRRFPIKASGFLQKLVLKALELISRDQRKINQELINSVEQLLNIQSLFRQEIQELRADIQVLESKSQKNADIRNDVSQAFRQIASLERLHRLNDVLNRNEITSLRQSIGSHASLPKSEGQTVPTGPTGPDLNSFFLSFDEEFRGTKEEVSDLLKVYLPLILNAKAGTAQAPILDIGCGRGEWLEFLKRNQTVARGVDLNPVLVDLCNHQGLEVICSDAIDYLKGIPSESLGAVTAFHLVEHLTFPVWVEMVDQIRRTLRPGGVVVFETPNPANFHVATHNFWLDPTHVKPIPSTFAKMLLESRGFERTAVYELHPYPEAMKLKSGPVNIVECLNEILYCAQDYAIVGHRPK
jgi:O-antigen chain-terminating methyltransferase